jgi:hypothetical protein
MCLFGASANAARKRQLFEITETAERVKRSDLLKTLRNAKQDLMFDSCNMIQQRMLSVLEVSNVNRKRRVRQSNSGIR